jgi:hypothetical protein
MTLEQAAIAALTTVTGILIAVVKYVHQSALKREAECIATNHALEAKLGGVSEIMGMLKAKVEIFERCNIENCPYTPETIRESRSERKRNE